MLVFGTKEFFDHIKRTLNGDKTFRRLGKSVYNATELIYLRDLKIGIWQRTVDGEIVEFELVPKRGLAQKEAEAEIVYYVRDYDTLLRFLRGEESFVAQVIDGTLEFKGPVRKALQIQAASERMEQVIRKICEGCVIPSKIEFQKWLSKEGYL